MPAAVRRRTGNLPTEVNSFVGRTAELADIRRLLGESHLVTLTGPGGVGKTRLVLRAAAGLVKRFPDGVWFVELADLEDPTLLDAAVAGALGLLALDPKRPRDSLVEILADRALLLVLDNCEHIVGDVAVLTGALLRRCPDLRVLATSREALAIPGERTLRVQPLELPDLENPAALASLAQWDAVTLFTERATTALPGFGITHDNHQAVLRIVHQLDGIPLAIELAAARLRTLSPGELADRLTDRYRLLTGGSRAAPARHQTLRMCVDWSYRQCTHQEQLLWSRLSVFVGGFELDAAEAVCGFGDLDPGDILDLLASLVSKSVVTRAPSGDVWRFRLLESLREYGHERLEEIGEYAVTRRRHRDWFADLTSRAQADLLTAAQADWWLRLDRELPNLRAAFDLTVMEPGAPNASTRLALNQTRYWHSRGLITEGRRQFARALADQDSRPDNDRVELLAHAAIYAANQEDLVAANALLEEAREIAAGPGVQGGIWVGCATGAVALRSGDLPNALRQLTTTAELARGRDRPALVLTLLVLTVVAGFMRDLALVARSHHETLTLTEPDGELWYRSSSLHFYGCALLFGGDPSAATALFRQSLRLQAELRDLLHGLWNLHALAAAAGHLDDHERAAVLLGTCAGLSRQLGERSERTSPFAAGFGDSERQARAALGDEDYETAHERGREMDYDERIAYATGDPITADASAGRPDTSPVSVLTARELEVAELVAQGLTNNKIAAKLFVSQRTARGHVENIFTKLGFNTRAQLATWYAEQGRLSGD